MDSKIEIIRPGANIHIQESQYLAGEREAEIAELRKDPSYNEEEAVRTAQLDDEALRVAMIAGIL